jgi:NAD(P)-dependent dehydrogenase (short-subunit alcohol dehydrogenase family)
MKSIVITGVSSGIGYGAAREFVKHGYHVFGSVRKAEDARSLNAELGTSFTPLLFDVTDREAVLGAAGQVGETVGDAGLAGLINNAGTALAGPLMHQPLDEIRQQFEINVLGLISVTQAFLPLLGAKKPPSPRPGRIVNISSVSGKVAEPFLGAYAGTKHAVEGVSDSLRRELLPYGIDVIVIRPGAVKTAIWEKGAASVIGDRYAQTDYADPLNRLRRYAERLVSNGYTPETFVGLVRKVFEAQRPKTRYTIVPGRFMDWTVPTSLPDRWLDRLIGRTLGLLRSPGQDVVS